MSDLLSIGRSGVLAYQGALQTIGENVTNANTDGYSRRTVTLTEQSTYSGAFSLTRSASAFGGVNASGVSRVWDQYKAQSAWTANSGEEGASTRAQYLTTMQTLMNDTNSGVGTRLTAVFTAATQLSANPADTSLRQAFLGSLSDVSATFHTTASDLANLSSTISTQASVLVDQTNTTLTTLAKVNLALKTTPTNTAARAQLEDQRDQLLGSLSATVGINTSFEADGSVTVRMNDTNGPILVSSKSIVASQLGLQTASDGRLSVSVIAEDASTTAVTPTSGALAGLVDSANTNAGRRQQLDGMAADLVTLFNNFQATGLTDAGAPGAALMSGTDASSIALATNNVADIAAASPETPIDPTVPVDPTTLPLTAAASNGNLLSLLSTARGSDGLEQRWKSMVTDQALQVSSANLQQSAASATKDTAYTSLDATTGVDLDNEAAELLRYQQAYSASAKVIQTARETFQSIIDLF